MLVLFAAYQEELQKDCLIYGHEDMVNFTTEELYQAIKARLQDEIEVFLTRLTDNT